jgi:glycine/D-amino acid oxidase-like deaminating enzyme
MIDALMPFAMNAYKSIGNELGIECIQQKDIVDFFPGPQMRMAFLSRLEQDPEFLSIPGDTMAWRNFLNYEFDYGIIQPCYLVDVAALLQAFRNRLIQKGWLIEEHFEEHEFVTKEDGIEYRNINAGKIIFCDGISSMQRNYFRLLPFAPNKGEVLIARINNLPATHIFKKGINIVPWKDDLFWIGSSHEWQFETEQPTIVFRDRTIAQLKAFVKLPFTIIDHWAAVRPATLERRPFIGFHPGHSNIGIFNGMGTKGCSLAPFFANALARHLTQEVPLPPEADIHRFKNLLGR